MSLTQLEGFQVGSDGSRVFVLDYAMPRVYVFNADGARIDSLGRKGRGPGEFQYPLALDVRDGVVSVIDFGTRRLVRWDTSGRLLASVPVGTALDNPKVRIGAGRLIYTVRQARPDGRVEYQLVSSDSGEQVVKAILLRQPRRVGDFPSCHATDISVQPLFAPIIIWDASDDRIVVNAGPDYVIRILARDGTGRCEPSGCRLCPRVRQQKWRDRRRPTGS